MNKSELTSTFFSTIATLSAVWLAAFFILLALCAVLSLSNRLSRRTPRPVPAPRMPTRPPPPMRGRILAADNSVLAYTTNQWEIRIDPQSPMGNTNVWTKPRIATALAKELDLPYTNLIAHLNNPKNRYIFLKETRDTYLIDRLSKHAKDWRLVIEKHQGRVYPLGEMAAHYVGAAGKSGTFYWEQRPLRGMFGVEYTQNETLADGQDIRLPLVPSLQTNLWSIVSRLKERYDANAAWAIAVTATNRTACILAMAKCPSYNPERYGSYREPQWENAPARFTFSLSDFTNSLAPPISTNTQSFGSALQLARAAAIQAAEGNDTPLRVTSVAPSEMPSQDVVALLVRRDECALVICVRAPQDPTACQRELEALDVDGLLRRADGRTSFRRSRKSQTRFARSPSDLGKDRASAASRTRDRHSRGWVEASFRFIV